MPFILDKTDKKILYLLSGNSRLSFAEISRIIKSNVPTVWHRVNKLIENNIIERFTSLIYRSGVGIKRQNEILIKISNITQEQKKKLIEIFVKHPRIIRVIEFQSGWNFSLTICGETIIDIKKIVDTIRKNLQVYNFEFTVLPTYHDETIRPLFFMENENFNLPTLEEIKSDYMHELLESRKKTPKYVEDLDHKDLIILQKLRDDSRITLLELSNILNIDSKAIDLRIKRMMKLSLLRSFNLQLNYETLGYSCFWLRLQLNVDDKRMEEFRKYMKKIHESYHYMEFLDMWNSTIIFLTKDTNKIEKIANDILSNFQDLIRSSETLNVKRQHKNVTYPEDIIEIYHGQISKDIY